MDTPPRSPKQLGYRMPAEWEPHAATWLSWPHNENSWPGRFERVPPVYAQFVAHVARSEPVRLNVNSLEMERFARAALRQAGAGDNVVFHYVPTNDAWCRDHGAMFVTRRSRSPDPAGLAAIDWRFNAWGGKYEPFDDDDRVAGHMADILGCPRFQPGMVMEGGAVDVNGLGLLLTTEACLLNPNRNPGLSRGQIEQALCDNLGVDEVLWLGEGIVGDDTDGHIDDLARFVGPYTVVAAATDDPADENHAILQRNLRTLEQLRLADGRKLDLCVLPMPPAHHINGQRTPATYVNFYIANTVVVMPGYHADTDREAARVLQACFPEREIVTLDCRDLIWGLGAFHCLSQQVPEV